ncbi:unnamed protein product [Blepharisma stoltei]|uniref:Thymidylate kinase n=1 Tax=Blepharisma stoltei TaxID=1481888 RepID=A0AAU9ISN0_9CILI|nr:unnamed protein product [Blepharisma stoltei]
MAVRGLFIVVEGIDRSGKSTFVRALAARLGNSEIMSFPNRQTQIGSMINSYLTNSIHMSDEAIHLLFSANRWECKGLIEQTLNAGKNVILDRYAYSGVVYSAAKGLDLEWCMASDIGLLKPDIVLYLKLDPREAQLRGNFGEERYEYLDLQKKVSDNYDMLMGKINNCKVLDAALPTESLLELAELGSVDTTKALEKLW